MTPQYSEKFLEFVKNNNIRNLTCKEQELLILLVDNDFGRLNHLINLYKNKI